MTGPPLQRQSERCIVRRFLRNLHKQNLYYLLWWLAYKVTREVYWMHKCHPADAAMARRWALIAYAGNEQAFEDVWKDWR